VADARYGDWVRIHDVLLESGERADHLPADTRSVPMEMWIKGSLKDDSAVLGDPVTVETVTGRLVEGVLVETVPAWNHGFGHFVPELQALASRIRDLRMTISKESPEASS